MSRLITALHLLKHPKDLIVPMAANGGFDWLDDKKYIKVMCKIRHNVNLNLDNPQTFNEKIQWLKLNYRNTMYPLLVDKYEAKEQIMNKPIDIKVIKTLGVWRKAEEIDFESLPSRFVLKCTHDSGSVVICRDKQNFDYQGALNTINWGLNHNMYRISREWPYRNVQPRIIAEEFMVDNQSDGLKDYKFFCFNGEPKFLYISEGLENHELAKMAFVSLEWEKMEFYRDDYRQYEQLPIKPLNFEKMIEISRSLSVGMPFVRIDLYEINGEVYFGEYTFFPAGLYMPILPMEWDYKIGNWLSIEDLS